MSARRPLVRCRALGVGFHGQAILPPIDLDIMAGELCAVIGRNGSGKTTWLRTLLGLLPPVTGRVERAPDLRISYLPQRKVMDELYPFAARDVVRLGVERDWSFGHSWLRREPPEVSRALEEMGVAKLANVAYRKLSEGEKQRVLFARLAVSGAQLAVLDEPTSAMDRVAEREAFELLDALRRRRGLAVVIVSHYLGIVEELADRAVLLDRDAHAVVAGTPAEVLKNRTFVTSFSVRPPPPEQVP
jgi:zinc transport system ATP-binding protein